MNDQSFTIKESEHVVIIELHDRSFSNFADAMSSVSDKHSKKKILMMQSIENEKNKEELKIVIVFEF